MKKINILLISAILLFFVIVTIYIHQKNSETNEIYVVTMTPPNMIQQFIAGNIDGFIAWEPFNAYAVLNENASYLIQSSEIWPNHPCCVLTVKTSDEDVIEGLLWAHIKATEFINNEDNKEKVVSYAENFTGMDEDVVKEALKHINYIEYPNEEEFKLYFYNLNQSGLLTKTPMELGYNNNEEFLDSFLVNSSYNEVKEKIERNPDWKPEFINKDIKVGYLTSDLHQLALYIGMKEGFYNIFKDVKFIQFQNGVEVMNAYRAGLIDAAYLGGAPATLNRINENIPIKIIAGANEIGSAIVVKKDITSLNDLKGKVIAIPGFGTVQDFLLRMAAGSVGLNVTLKK